jgi:hypothetical protein
MASDALPPPFALERVLEDVLDQLADQYGVEDIATAASPVRLTSQAPQT